MQPILQTSATIFQPCQGKTFTFMGNIVTYKFNPGEVCDRMFEVSATAISGRPPLHTHPWDETFYILAGEVEFQAGNQVIRAKPGCVIHLPAGVAHTFQMESLQTKFLVWVSNAAAEAYIQELATLAQQRSLSPTEVMAIGQKHQIQLVK